MKNLIAILFLSLCLTANSQEKCVTVKVEKIENYRVRITKTDTCKNVITVTTMLEKDWRSRKNKRKKLKNKKNDQ
tara:strand:+ start:1316 stop:1540 length:225 start_codon:yes stop_codon:yes gene_type:complete